MSIHPSRQAYVEEGENEDNETGVSLNNIPTTSTAAPASGPQESTTLLSSLRRKRSLASLAVPTDDKRVRIDLRARGHPITLFGERPEDRRDRLREILYAEHRAQHPGAGDDDDVAMGEAGDDGDLGGAEAEGDEEDIGEFYTEGTPELLAARRAIAKFSLPRAQRRIEFQRLESTIPVETHVRFRKGVKEKLGRFELYGSQIASQRPVSMVRFAPDGRTLAAGDWGGAVRILDVPALETRGVLRGHKGMIGGLAWYPRSSTEPTSSSLSNIDATSSTLDLASGGGEGDIHLWSTNQDTPIATLSGHSARVVRTEFHPSTQYLASASYDTSWRLWDLPTQTQLLLQEGHAKEVYTVAFSTDGSLLASAGLDSIGRVWDLRSGRTVMLMEGHVAPIHALDWSPDGVRVMSGSADGFAKCWDLRQVRESASLGAHRGGVADLRWFKGDDGPLSGKAMQTGSLAAENGEADDDVNMPDGENEEDEFSEQKEVRDAPAPKTSLIPKKSGTFVLTAGFDNAVNIFSADDWALCKSLTGHDGTVLAVDTTSDARWIASCGRDRTVKLWGIDGEGELGL